MIQIAVVGPGNISRRFMKGMKHVSGARVSAFVSRHPEAVTEYASQYGVERIGTMEEILLSPGIDAVYISTPNHVHEEQIRFCLERGLHVLCEKPITVSSSAYRDMLDLAHEKWLVLMEAQKTLYTPVFRSIKETLDQGLIGTVQSAEAGFCRNEGLPSDAWRMNTPGKGALYDVGCYPLSALFGLFGCGFEETGRSASFAGDTDIAGVIRLSDGTLPLTVRYAMAEDGLCDLIIRGSEKTIVCHEFWKAQSYEISENGKSETRTFPFESEFSFEAQHFIDRILQNEIEDPAHEAITMSVLKILER